MTPSRCSSLIFCGLVLLIVTPAVAGPMHVGDGNLADWGVSLSNSDRLVFEFVSDTTLPTTFNTNNLGVTGVGAVGSFQFNYFIEDQNDGAGLGGQLDPHQGGQAYDAEFMATAIDNGFLVIAIVTGQHAGNLLTNFAPGDIMIETSEGTFGVEVGGGAGGQNRGSATNVEREDAGTFYVTNGNGYTLTSGGVVTDPTRVAGSVWEDPVWVKSKTPSQGFTQMKSGSGVNAGLADSYLYSFLPNSQHAFIEVAIPLGYFGGADLVSVSWAPVCNNDIVTTGITHMPEPTSLAMLLIGGLGLCGYRQRQDRTSRQRTAESGTVA